MCYVRPDLGHIRKTHAYLEDAACRMMSGSPSPMSSNPCLAQKQPARGPVKLDNAGACYQPSMSVSVWPAHQI